MSAPRLTFGFPPGSAIDAPAPDGFRLLERRRIVGRGRADVKRLGTAVLAWRLQRGSGIAVESPDGGQAPPVTTDLDVVLRVPIAGAGSLGLTLSAPARVTRVVTGRERIGFAYGTLPGHPEVGEEAFTVTRLDDDRVELTVRAISRTAFPFALALPVANAFQRRYTGRYLRALDGI